MCTVTFIPSGEKIFITSSRDEKIVRRQASPPALHDHRGCGLVYPKDLDAGGTWIALNVDGNTAVLLNGAFESYIPQPFHLKSRGLIVVDILAGSMPITRFTKIDLYFVAPFTLILWDHNRLFECRWDGCTKYCKQLDITRPYIWSSATLYNTASMKKRTCWFDKFLNNTAIPGMNDILNFHREAGDGNESDNIMMKREGKYSTVSITSIGIGETGASIVYYDCQDDSNHQQNIIFKSLGPVNQSRLYEAL